MPPLPRWTPPYQRAQQAAARRRAAAEAARRRAAAAAKARATAAEKARAAATARARAAAAARQRAAAPRAWGPKLGSPPIPGRSVGTGRTAPKPTPANPPMPKAQSVKQPPRFYTKPEQLKPRLAPGQQLAFKRGRGYYAKPAVAKRGPVAKPPGAGSLTGQPVPPDVREEEGGSWFDQMLSMLLGPDEGPKSPFESMTPQQLVDMQLGPARASLTAQETKAQQQAGLQSSFVTDMTSQLAKALQGSTGEGAIPPQYAAALGSQAQANAAYQQWQAMSDIGAKRAELEAQVPGMLMDIWQNQMSAREQAKASQLDMAIKLREMQVSEEDKAFDRDYKLAQLQNQAVKFESDMLLKYKGLDLKKEDQRLKRAALQALTGYRQGSLKVRGRQVAAQTKAAQARLRQSGQRVKISQQQLKLAQQKEARLAIAAAKKSPQGYTPQQVNSAQISAAGRILSLARELRGKWVKGNRYNKKDVGHYEGGATRAQAFARIRAAEEPSLLSYGFTAKQIRAMINTRLDIAGFGRPKKLKKVPYSRLRP
jgi:hypothetical protein